MSGEQMKLTYFNLLGRAEVIRYLFKLAGKEFIDHRTGGDAWKELKPKTPKGQIPILEVGGQVICESTAIVRYVARECNLYGSNNLEAAICDQAVDTARGVMDLVADFKYRSTTEDDKAAAKVKAESGFQDLDKFLASLKKKGSFILGDKVSVADTVLYRILEMSRTMLADFSFESCTTLCALEKNFKEVPAIAEWIRTRPETSM